MSRHPGQRLFGMPARIRLNGPFTSSFISPLTGPLTGIVLTVTLHALLIFLLHQQTPLFSTKPDRPAALTVHLHAAPNHFPTPASRPGQPPATSEPATSRPRSDSQNVPRQAASAPPQRPSHEARNNAINIDGIYQNIGKVIGDIDRENGSSPAGQLHAKRRDAFLTESALSRNVAKAGRDDCLAPNSLPGGLLAPVYLLMDKKGAGCKFQ